MSLDGEPGNGGGGGKEPGTGNGGGGGKNLVTGNGGGGGKNPVFVMGSSSKGFCALASVLDTGWAQVAWFNNLDTGWVSVSGFEIWIQILGQVIHHNWIQLGYLVHCPATWIQVVCLAMKHQRWIQRLLVRRKYISRRVYRVWI